jgi:hypothetical protein
MQAPLRRVWQARTPNPVFEAPIAGDTTVLAQSVHEVYGLWAHDGALRWQFPQTGGRWMQWVLRTRFGPVVHGSVDGRWRVVGLGFDGAPRWSLPAERHGTVGAPARDGRGLWLAMKNKGGPSSVRRVDRDGAVVAKCDAIDDVTHLVEVEGALLLAGAHRGTEGLYRMALPSGDIARVWSGATEFIARHAGRVFVSEFESSSDWSRLVALDERGAEVWSARANLPDFHRTRVLAMAPGDGGARVVSLDARTGKVLWSRALDEAGRLTRVVGVADLACVTAWTLDVLDLDEGTSRQRLGESDESMWRLDGRSGHRDRLVVSDGDDHLVCWQRARDPV